MVQRNTTPKITSNTRKATRGATIAGIPAQCRKAQVADRWYRHATVAQTPKPISWMIRSSSAYPRRQTKIPANTDGMIHLIMTVPFRAPVRDGARVHFITRNWLAAMCKRGISRIVDRGA